MFLLVRQYPSVLIVIFSCDCQVFVLSLYFVHIIQIEKLACASKPDDGEGNTVDVDLENKHN